MEKNKADIIILGGGLAGLNLARLLKKVDISATVLEARNRIGGRINTIEQNGVSLELGATWFSDKHIQLMQLIKELDIQYEEQFYGNRGIYEAADGQTQLFDIGPQAEQTYRFTNGTKNLINALSAPLSPEQIMLNHQVKSIIFDGTNFLIDTNKGEFACSIVVNTLPPNLLINRVKFSPDLTKEYKSIAQTTHTWMGESIKVGFFSSTPFWKSKGIGTIYSQRGPITEMYDHSNAKGFALKGFIHDSFATFSKAEREKAIRTQLSNLFGKEFIESGSYIDSVWKNEISTYFEYPSFVGPHQHNGHHILNKPQFNGQFIMTGSETASQFPGYMDGAIEASLTALGFLKAQRIVIADRFSN